MSEYSDMPVLEACRDSYPERPDIDVATTPWTRDVLARKIDHYMFLLDRAAGKTTI